MGVSSELRSDNAEMPCRKFAHFETICPRAKLERAAETRSSRLIAAQDVMGMIDEELLRRGSNFPSNLVHKEDSGASGLIV